jgi:Fe-S-cluster-containing hydrogenase component 2
MLHVIEQEHCLRCRNCLEVCTPQIKKQSIYIDGDRAEEIKHFAKTRSSHEV